MLALTRDNAPSLTDETMPSLTLPSILVLSACLLLNSLPLSLYSAACFLGGRMKINISLSFISNEFSLSPLQYYLSVWYSVGLSALAVGGLLLMKICFGNLAIAKLLPFFLRTFFFFGRDGLWKTWHTRSQLNFLPLPTIWLPASQTDFNLLQQLFAWLRFVWLSGYFRVEYLLLCKPILTGTTTILGNSV